MVVEPGQAREKVNLALHCGAQEAFRVSVLCTHAHTHTHTHTRARAHARGPAPQPNVMRVAPAPLYNTAEDVRVFVTTLVAVLEGK